MYTFISENINTNGKLSVIQIDNNNFLYSLNVWFKRMCVCHRSLIRNSSEMPEEDIDNWTQLDNLPDALFNIVNIKGKTFFVNCFKTKHSVLNDVAGYYIILYYKGGTYVNSVSSYDTLTIMTYIDSIAELIGLNDADGEIIQNYLTSQPFKTLENVSHVKYTKMRVNAEKLTMYIVDESTAECTRGHPS